MINKYHGKVYYIEVRDREEMKRIKHLINESETLQKETFYENEEGNVIYSKAVCGSFRGTKYREWEKIKSEIYRSRLSK